MALGGGQFLVQNKVLPGSYINFVSAARASHIFTDRGYAALALALDWGEDSDIITMDAGELQKDSLELFGREYTHEQMRPLREVFQGAKELFLYRLNGNGDKARATIGNLTATARYGGIRGNDFTVSVQADVDSSGKHHVITYLDGQKMDDQLVSSAEELLSNTYLNFSGSGELTQNAGTKLTGGTNKAVTAESYSTFLEKIEKYDFNAIGYAGTDDQIKNLFVSFTKRMRDDHGVKFQTVLHQKADADHEGVISVENRVLDEGSSGSELVYWTIGKEAGVAVNRSLTNARYNGEYKVDVDYKQRDLEKGIKAGKLMFHLVGDKVRVLQDINTFTEFSLYKNSDFAMNQVIRVLDQIAKDISIIFNTIYLGKVQNNQDGRIGFWNEVVTHHKKLQTLGAIEEFLPEDVTVEKGEAKNAVVVMDKVMPIVCMEKLYMTVVVR